jgi:HSP20 family protein
MANLIRLTGLEGLAALEDRMNRLVEEVFGGERALARGAESGWVPVVDMFETPESVVVKLEAPGVDPARINLAVSGDHLEVSGEKPAEEPPKESRWFRFERRTGEFRRRIPLPFPVDANKIEASSKNGLVTIHLPKRSEVLPKRIAVKPA